MENPFENLKWVEFTPKNIQAFSLGDEPEVIYVIKNRDNEYIVVHADGYDLDTGKTEFHNQESLKKKFKIDVK